jgi:hypothetical protein
MKKIMRQAKLVTSAREEEGGAANIRTKKGCLREEIAPPFL